MFHNIGLPELLIIFVIILLIFGAGRLSDIGRSLGEGVANFVKGIRSTRNEIEKTSKENSSEKKTE